MIQHIEIRGFQSLYHVDLDLAPLTVIVGASSSGKSAMTRALRLLTMNSRGSSFISHGERLTVIRAVTERGSVILKRGKQTDDNEYQVIPSGPDEQPRTWTKLNATVPEEVSAFLGISAKDPLNYAGQFDSPYLLKDSGGDVARTLGSLTNVNVIFEGARESNRQKLEQSRTLKTRQGDLSATDPKVETYRSLKARIQAVTAAEGHLADAQALEARIARLRLASEQLMIANRSLDTLSTQADVVVPDDTEVVEAAARLQSLRTVIAELRSAGIAYRDADSAEDDARHDIEMLEHDYMMTLRTAGTCPTCGQSTHSLEEVHA